MPTFDSRDEQIRVLEKKVEAGEQLRRDLKVSARFSTCAIAFSWTFYRHFHVYHDRWSSMKFNQQESALNSKMFRDSSK